MNEIPSHRRHDTSVGAARVLPLPSSILNAGGCPWPVARTRCLFFIPGESALTIVIDRASDLVDGDGFEYGIFAGE